MVTVPVAATWVGSNVHWSAFLSSQTATHKFEGASNSDVEPVHQPVLLPESLQFLAVTGGGTYVDGTLGEGGHSEGILEASGPDGVVLGIDRDPRSLAVARRRLDRYGARAILVHGNYAEMHAIALEHGITAVDGILLDLGFSSRQVNTAGYGFSFQTDEPLDMRYDREGETAADIVNSENETDLGRPDLPVRRGKAESRHRAGDCARQAHPDHRDNWREW